MEEYKSPHQETIVSKLLIAGIFIVLGAIGIFFLAKSLKGIKTVQPVESTVIEEVVE